MMNRFAPALTLAAALCGCGAKGGEPWLAIGEVSFNQGAKRVLTAAPGETSLPLIAGRDGLLRVAYSSARAGQRLDATLSLGDGRGPIEGAVTLAPASVEADLDSTLNFQVPGERLGGAAPWTLRLSSGEELALHPGAAAPRSTLKVTLVPFSYDADGSHRLPDLSAAQLERYRARLLGMYPVADVELSVRAARPWPTAMDRSGGGWRELGFELFKLRQADQVQDDVYYFGVVDPAATLEAYCSGPCLVGLTVWNDDPIETGKADLRLALGVGFPEVAADSAAHELGHAHGLRHAPCGDALDASSIDGRFPHDGGRIGAAGWDITRRALVPAEATDIMGYCEKRWISDYHFARLLQRSGRVNGALLAERPVRVEHDVLRIDGEGAARWEPGPVAWAPVAGRRVAVRLEGDASQRLETEGRWLSFDHLDGGWVLVPRPAWRAVRAELVGPGMRATAVRGSAVD